LGRRYPAGEPSFTGPQNSEFGEGGFGVAQPKKPAVSEGELLDRSFVAAMRHRWHYPGHATREAAVAGLRRRRPGFPAPQYERAFDKAVALYQRATEVVQRHFARFPEKEQWRAADVPRDITDELRGLAPGFRLSTYRYAVGCILDWHHWR
jgi:hypothetical protein